MDSTSNVTKIPIHRGIDNTILSRFALIDSIYAPTITPFRWLLFNPDTPPYIGVEISYSTAEWSRQFPLSRSQRQTHKRIPIFLNRLIFALANGHVLDPDNLISTITFIKTLQRLRFMTPDKFDCRLANIDARLSPRAVVQRRERSEATGSVGGSHVDPHPLAHPYPFDKTANLNPHNFQIPPNDTGSTPPSGILPTTGTDLEDEALVKDVLDILGGPPDLSPVVSKSDLRIEQQNQNYNEHSNNESEDD